MGNKNKQQKQPHQWDYIQENVLKYKINYQTLWKSLCLCSNGLFNTKVYKYKTDNIRPKQSKWNIFPMHSLKVEAFIQSLLNIKSSIIILIENNVKNSFCLLYNICTSFNVRRYVWVLINFNNTHTTRCPSCIFEFWFKL